LLHHRLDGAICHEFPEAYPILSSFPIFTQCALIGSPVPGIATPLLLAPIAS
jgi:hypothetical protein